MSTIGRYAEPVARDLMAGFAERTGLTGKHPPRRYLWTDAFAVCNFLELHRRTKSHEELGLALRLIDQVHDVLGRHRDDDPREGWLSGLGDEEARERPTAGGLRIGKPLNERRPPAPVDPRLEWERDGQYFHYLTRWMHALNRASRATGDVKYLRWALELAVVAHSHFTYPTRGGSKRFYWKMSVDLTYPLVPSMGQHDPLDALVTYSELQAAAAEWPDHDLPDLAEQIRDSALILQDAPGLVSDDPLGIGGLLTDAFRLAQLLAAGASTENELLGELIEAAALGLDSFARKDTLSLPSDIRVPFRELGLAIGLLAADRLEHFARERQAALPGDPILSAGMEAVHGFIGLEDEIVTRWLEPNARASQRWASHRDINEVMLATAMVPDEYLTATPQAARVANG